MKRLIYWLLNKNEIAGATSLLAQCLMELRMIRTELQLQRVARGVPESISDAIGAVHNWGPVEPVQPFGTKQG